jgi:hypothetical protein
MFEEMARADPAGFLNAVSEQLTALPAQLWRTQNQGFADIAAAALDNLSVQADCARVGQVQEAQSRGVVDASPSPTATDWLLTHTAHLEPADAAQTVKPARLCGQPRNQIIAAAVSAGTLTVRKAMTALSHHVQYWADGGPTSLLNLALTAATHHTLIHTQNLTATVTDVTWHTNMPRT